MTKELFSLEGEKNILSLLSEWFKNSEVGRKGLEEVQYVLDSASKAEINTAEVKLDVTLARGLNYYTGTIYEVLSNEVKMGSIVGGGRYDDLTGVFGLQGLSGIGISFGAERIYDVLSSLDRFPELTKEGVQLLFVNFGEKEADYCEKLLRKARRNGINAELYPDAAKMQKQMKYANAKGVTWVAMVGEDEMENNSIRLKNMITGEQEDLDLAKMITRIQE
jgi:histidyl-tRNA synthetase